MADCYFSHFAQVSMDDLGKKLSIFSFGIIAIISIFGVRMLRSCIVPLPHRNM